MPRSGSIHRKKTSTPAFTTGIVALYARASTDQQENSIHGQLEAASSYATANQLTIHPDLITQDLGTSAVKLPFLQRPAVIKLLRQCERAGVNQILIHKPDRAFRNTLDLCQTLIHLSERGIYIRLITPDIDLSKPIGRLIIQLLTAVAEMEISTKSERVDAAYESLRRRRISRNGSAENSTNPNIRPSYGWITHATPTGTSAKGKPIYVQTAHPEEQVILRLIVDMHQQSQGQHGILTTIARHLNDLGVPSPSAGKTLVKKGGITYTASHEWNAAKVTSVIEHQVLATEEELPTDLLPSLEQAVAALSKRHANPTQER